MFLPVRRWCLSRYGMIKPRFVLPHSTPKGPVPRENGGVGAIPRVSTEDSPSIRDYAAQCPEDNPPFLEWFLPLLVQVLVAGPLHHTPLLTSQNLTSTTKSWVDQ